MVSCDVLALEVVALQETQHSRGSLFLESTDMRSAPSVQANLLDHPEDMAQQLRAMNRILSILNTSSIRQHARRKVQLPIRAPPLLQCVFDGKGTDSIGMVLPCPPDLHNKNQTEQWARDNMISSYHYFGTAALGTVVDPTDFSLKGTQGLFAVDGSILPIPTRVNPVGTIMALGHYAAKVISSQPKVA